jgi:predicted permease
MNRQDRERDMQEELKALEAIAGRKNLGNLALAAENARAVWRWGWLDGLIADLRYGLRVLARQPSFAAVAVLSLGLGIGADAAIFSLMDTLLWRQLPVRQPERLVTFDCCVSYPTFQQFQARSKATLESVLATAGAQTRDLDTGGGPQAGMVELVSGNYFGALGVGSALGRTIVPEDDRRGQVGMVAVLSHAYWQRAYDGNPSAVGRTIRVGKLPFTICGVAPPEFFGVTVGQTPDLWLPLAALPMAFPGRQWLDKPNTNFLWLLGRLPGGVAAERASAALTPIWIALDLERTGPGLPDWVRKQIEGQQLKLTPASNGLSSLRRRFSKPLRVLMAMVGIGLLLACLNVMSLQFARADQRRRELTVRLAIGAGRFRIVRQLLTEALMLAFGGALLGLAICRPAAAALVSLIANGGNPVQLPMRIDGAMLLFVTAVCVVAALLCGLIPALRASRSELVSGLQQSSRSAAGPASRWMARSAASLQLALSVVLIAGSFLFASSLYRLAHFHTGLDRTGLVELDVDTREAGYQGPRATDFNRRLLERLTTLPGVQAVTFSEDGVFSGRNSNAQLGAEGFVAPDGEQRSAFYDTVGPRYFTTLGARLVSGRDFDEKDNATAPRVAIVNQEFARHFFPGQNPIGRTIYRLDEKHPTEVIGVAEDIRSDVRRMPPRYFYVPQWQSGYDLFSTRYLVRARPAARLFSDLRAAVRAEDPAVRIIGIDTADSLLDRTLDLDRLIAALSFGFGVLALTLAAVGTYGLLAYDVTRRTGELGIRMALGATRTRVMGLVFREVWLAAAPGIVLGTAASMALGRLVAGLVFEMRPADPRVLASAGLVLAAVALCAAWIPARRAAQLDPMGALRNE